MTITYSKATPSDAKGFAHCQIEAFLEDRFYQACFGVFPNGGLEILQENLDYRINRWKDQFQNTNIHWIKAVDDATGTVVGISGWEVPKSRQTKDFMPGRDAVSDVRLPSSWNKETLDLADKRAEEVLKANSVESDRLWYVAMMAVLPSYRGQGIAQQLMNRGMSLADDAGEGMYLESTPAAKKLYERNGFDAIGIFELPEGYISDVMVRKAQ